MTRPAEKQVLARLLAFTRWVPRAYEQLTTNLLAIRCTIQLRGYRNVDLRVEPGRDPQLVPAAGPCHPMALVLDIARLDALLAGRAGLFAGIVDGSIVAAGLKRNLLRYQVLHLLLALYARREVRVPRVPITEEDPA